MPSSRHQEDHRRRGPENAHHRNLNDPSPPQSSFNLASQPPASSSSSSQPPALSTSSQPPSTDQLPGSVLKKKRRRRNTLTPNTHIKSRRKYNRHRYEITKERKGQISSKEEEEEGGGEEEEEEEEERGKEEKEEETKADIEIKKLEGKSVPMSRTEEMNWRRYFGIDGHHFT